MPIFTRDGKEEKDYAFGAFNFAEKNPLGNKHFVATTSAITSAWSSAASSDVLHLKIIYNLIIYTLILISVQQA